MGHDTSKRVPGSVWIEKRQLRSGKISRRIRWIDPATGRVDGESCGMDAAYARDRRASKQRELLTGESKRQKPRRASELRNALDGWMAGKSDVTLRKTRLAMDKLMELVGDVFVAHIDRARLMEFRSKRLAEGVSVATVNRDIRGIGSAMGYAVDAGWIGSSPLSRWKGRFLREAQQVVRVVEPAEFEKLLAAAGTFPVRMMDGPSIQVFLQVSYYQGLRRHELVKLRWEDVDLEAGTLRVVNIMHADQADELTKSRRNRVMPLRSIVRQALAAQFERAPKIVLDGAVRPKWEHVFTRSDGRPWGIDYMSHAFPGLVEAAGIEPCSLHDLRRSWSTLAQRAGIDRALIKDLGGWSTVAVLERHYTGEVGEAYRRATAQLDRQSEVG